MADKDTNTEGSFNYRDETGKNPKNNGSSDSRALSKVEIVEISIDGMCGVY